MKSRILIGVVIPALVLAFLLWIRRDITVKPFELAWFIWVGAILASGSGLGWGQALIWLKPRAMPTFGTSSTTSDRGPRSTPYPSP